MMATMKIQKAITSTHASGSIPGLDTFTQYWLKIIQFFCVYCDFQLFNIKGKGMLISLHLVQNNDVKLYLKHFTT